MKRKVLILEAINIANLKNSKLAVRRKAEQRKQRKNSLLKND